jgi:hypothetical protein
MLELGESRANATQDLRISKTGFGMICKTTKPAPAESLRRVMFSKHSNRRSVTYATRIAGASVRKTMKILVGEDEPKTASYLRNGLIENGFVADVSGRGDDGRDVHALYLLRAIPESRGTRKASVGRYDLIDRVPRYGFSKRIKLSASFDVGSSVCPVGNPFSLST